MAKISILKYQYLFNSCSSRHMDYTALIFFKFEGFVWIYRVQLFSWCFAFMCPKLGIYKLDSKNIHQLDTQELCIIFPNTTFYFFFIRFIYSVLDYFVLQCPKQSTYKLESIIAIHFFNTGILAVLQLDILGLEVFDL